MLDHNTLLRGIHEEDPDSMLLVNLSSGTPAMKSALNVISVLAQYPMQAVQVSTPNQRENPKDEDPDDYDVDAFWECNQDNEQGFRNRCHEVKGEHLLVKIKKESIRRLLDAYNYKAALMLAQDIADFIPEQTMRMLQAAEYRLQLDQRGYTKATKGIDCKFQPIEAADQCQLFEYVLSLQIKMKQGNYADFLRGLTPVVLDLFTMCLKNQLKITPDMFCQKGRNEAWRISTEVMRKSSEGMQVMNALQQGFRDLSIKEDYLGSMPIMKIFEMLSADIDLVKDLRRMRDIETDVRNVAAHEIVSVTDEWIYAKTKMHTEDIMKLLKRLVVCAGVKAKNEFWDSYAAMNKK